MIRAIPFATESECIAFQSVLLARIQHLSGWIPFSPLLLTDGRWVAQIADTLLAYLTPEEAALIVDIDPSLILQPEPRN